MGHVDPVLRLLYTSAMLRRGGFALALLALSLGCALLVGRLPPDLERTVVTRRHHGSDPLLSAALLRFGVDSLLHNPWRYFRPPILHPDPNPLRGTEPLLAEALLAVPLRLALGERPLAVYTCVKLTSLALVALFTGLLLRELRVRKTLCLLGGGMALLVGTMPLFADRLQAISIQWLPLAGLFATRFLRGRRRRDAVFFALAVFLAAQASLYTTAMLLLPLPFLFPALWPWRAGAPRRFGPLLAAVGVAAAASLVVLSPYLAARADVAAYSSADYAEQKTWNPAALAAFVVSPPEYAAWPLGPGADWTGLFPGTAFVMLIATVAVLALLGRTRGGAAARDGSTSGFPFRLSGRVQRIAWLGLLAAAVASATAAPGGRASAVGFALADVFLWAMLLAWPVRLAVWPRPAGGASDEPPLAFLASAAALAALVLWLTSLGTPIRWQAGGEPLASGLFGTLSRALPPIRELRELNRCLLPAGWLAVFAATLSFERHLRRLRSARALTLGQAVAVAILTVGVAERTAADTRKDTAAAVPAGYALLRGAPGSHGLLELPVDPWGRIDSVHRMLWQATHGRPIVAGRTGIEPAWYGLAQRVFDEFPSDESLRLAREWDVDSVLDNRSDVAREWPSSVVRVGERAAPEGERTTADWRLFALHATPDSGGIEAEPAPPPGRWLRPSASRAGDRAACDGLSATAVHVTEPDGIEFAVPSGATLAGIEIDYGHGLHNRVPRTLRVQGLEDGVWHDLASESAVARLRARVALQLLRTQAAHLTIPLRTSRAVRLRLAAPDVPWDLPELRLRATAP